MDDLGKSFAKKVTAAAATITISILCVVAIGFTLSNYLEDKRDSKIINTLKGQLDSRGYTFEYVKGSIESNKYGKETISYITLNNFKTPSGTVYTMAKLKLIQEHGDGGGSYPTGIYLIYPKGNEHLNLI